MKQVEPKVFLVARPDIDWSAVKLYLDAVGATDSWWDARAWTDRSPGQDLVEFAGRACYKSWEPGLNPNVTKIRTDQDPYLENILGSGHGSVLEHATFSFAFHNLSRVCTAELNRHRAGVAISEQSMRFVRLTEIPMWIPDWAKQDEYVMHEADYLLAAMEAFQDNMSAHFGLDDEGTPFHEKKHKTSFMRRFAPMGVATEEVWTANIRTIRHVVETRTADGAEEEIRMVFGKVAELMTEELPVLFGDFEKTDGGSWVPKWRKV